MSLAPAPQDVLVAPGQSIQEALDAAGPGVTIRLEAGTYAEHLWIRHGGVTLVGAGPGRTVLRPGGEPTASIPQLTDAPEGAVSGISVHGTGEPVEGVTLRGITITGFPGAGVHAHSATDLTVEDVAVEDNAVWGIYLRESERLTVRRCQASGSQYGGVALSFCSGDTSLITDTETHTNGFGLFVDNSSHARLVGNRAHGNAAGVMLLNQTYPGEPPGGVRDCLVIDNDIHANNLAAGGGDPEVLAPAGPPISGVGVAVIGTTRVALVHNRISGHRPSGFSVMGGAVTLASSKEWGGADPVDNTVLGNEITDNEPHDLQVGSDLDRQLFRGNLAPVTDPAGIDGCAGEAGQ
ncbi:nitrous oxidase accessory protein [Actinoalloteichus sp. AHMU CJ021]|uniref:right-handed parallel beta-helix repeat-containing protein n=1 Tax=Actinoalloteichus TaxID=65496 RepID=UPI00036615C2|nr:right-handed parallel beta-helix repeat-containing protein [Actinoalloteichus spitiensis]AUS77256.1 nitrous oxidase accessory protein [Actinoalloteichus sp. AHMU CJ021]